MRITKKQIAVITVLNIVIAGLIAALIFWRTPRLAEGGGTTPDDDGDNGTVVTAPPHEKLRDPQKGKVKEIAFETRLMGSGDESVVFTFSAGGVTYIFGNAVVPDYDFDSSGGYMCRISSSGEILGFTYFDGKLSSAGVVEGGFCAAAVVNVGTDDEKSYLYAVGDDGTADRLSSVEGTVVDVMTVDSKKMAVIAAIGEGTLKLTEFTRAGDGWALGSSTRISNVLKLQYFDCYISRDGYVISARAFSNPRYDAIVFYTLRAGGDAVPHYYGGNDESMVRPYAVLPYDNGYIAVCDKSGEAAIVTVDYGFTSFRRDMLGFQFSGAQLLELNGKYYACFVDDNGGITYELDSLLNRKTVSAISGSRLGAVVNMDNPLFVCTTASAVTIKDGADISVSLDIKDCVINRIIKTGYKEMLIVLTAKGGGALSTPTGGADVYAVSVKV
ncbi:MAG: hypothetical protein K2M47_07170 [Clostridiales bacterium]|nr:hypothetical protein [Clostridiales bacterium]